MAFRLSLHRLFHITTLSAFTRTLTGLLIVLAFSAHVFDRFDIPLLRQLERNAYDLHLKAVMPNTVDPRIVIADIDDASLQELGQWPWRRSVIADLLDTLFDYYHIKTVGFDAVFPEEDRSDGLRLLQTMADGELGKQAEFQRAYKILEPQLHYDDRLGEALKDRRVVLGVYFEKNQSIQKNWLNGDVGELDESLRHKLPVSRPHGYTANVPILQLSAKASGFFDNPTLDDDGIFRRVAPVQEYDGKLYPSLALALAQQAMDDAPISLDVKHTENGDYYSMRSIYLGDFPIHLDMEKGYSYATVLVPYRGEQYSFPYISIAGILARKTDMAILQDRIVIIGTTAAGLKDLRATPVQRDFAGVEVHANLISGMLDNRLMYQPSWMTGLNIALVLCIGLLMTAMIGRLSAVLSLLFSVSLIAALLITRAWLWNKGLFMPVVPVILMILMLFMLDILFSYFTTERAKKSIQKNFGQYVPPEIVADMAEKLDDISLESTARELTVLFSDVRGFTTLSEKVPAEELSQLMNALLTPLTQVIHSHRGTIDKYMGDAIMGFWGAPLQQPDHAMRAVGAALAMQEAVKTINLDFAQRGWLPISIGVGLNTGVMAVGNMGSSFRAAYTVLGDAVNLGSRLEGLTKQYGAAVIVGESTRAAAPEYLYRELDRVRVKGKDQPVSIFEPLKLRSAASAQEVEENQQLTAALQAYRTQDWENAARIFSGFRQRYPDVVLYELYLERVEYFRVHDPGSEWDGVFTHKTK